MKTSRCANKQSTQKRLERQDNIHTSTHTHIHTKRANSRSRKITNLNTYPPALPGLNDSDPQEHSIFPFPSPPFPSFSLHSRSRPPTAISLFHCQTRSCWGEDGCVRPVARKNVIRKLVCQEVETFNTLDCQLQMEIEFLILTTAIFARALGSWRFLCKG